MALHGSRSQHGDDRTKQIVLALLAAGADPNARRSKYDWRGCGHSESAFDMLLGSAFGTGVLPCPNSAIALNRIKLLVLYL